MRVVRLHSLSQIFLEGNQVCRCSSLDLPFIRYMGENRMRLSHQLPHKLLEDMGMMINVILRVLD